MADPRQQAREQASDLPQPNASDGDDGTEWDEMEAMSKRVAKRQLQRSRAQAELKAAMVRILRGFRFCRISTFPASADRSEGWTIDTDNKNANGNHVFRG